MNDRLEKYAIVWSWKLHTDTGEHMPELPPIYEDGKEVRFFKVKGSKRPAIVWNSNSSKARLIMLTSQGASGHVRELGDVVGNGTISYFDPDKHEWKWYPMRLIESEGHPLSNKHRQRLFEELNQHEMTHKPPKTSS